MENQAHDLNLKPKQVMTLLLSNTTGAAKTMIQHYANDFPLPTEAVIAEIWEDLKTGYGQIKLLTKQIKSDLFSLPKVVDGPNIKIDLCAFHDICRSVLNIQATCLGLPSLDNDESIKQLVNKLPQRVLRRWKNSLKTLTRSIEISIRRFMT